MKTGFSLLEILHRENPVFITGMGLQCALSVKYGQEFYSFCEKFEKFEHFSFIVSFTSGLEINFVCLVRCIYLVKKIILILDKIKKSSPSFPGVSNQEFNWTFLLPTVRRLLFLAAVAKYSCNKITTT